MESPTDSGSVLVEKLINFIIFAHSVTRRMINYRIPPACEAADFPEEKRAELVAHMEEAADKGNDATIELIKSLPKALIYQLMQAQFMNNLDLCEQIMDKSISADELAAAHLNKADPTTDAMMHGALTSVCEAGKPEEIDKMRRYLQLFISLTVGDLQNARVRYEANKEFFLAQAETIKRSLVLPENAVCGGHLGSDGVSDDAGGDGEGAGGDGEGRAEEEGKGKEVDRSEEGPALAEGQSSSGHYVGAYHAPTEGASGSGLSSSGCSQPGSDCSSEEGSSGVQGPA